MPGSANHSGMVVMAPDAPGKAERLERVLTTDPGIGIFRHADASYDLARQVGEERGVKIPGRK